MKTVRSYLKVEEAHLAAGYLESCGIEAFVKDDETVGLVWAYSNAIGGVKVEVADEDLQRATELLVESAKAEGMLQCPHCGSNRVKMREMRFVSFLSYIVLGFLFPAKPRTVDCLDCRRSFEVEKKVEG